MNLDHYEDQPNQTLAKALKILEAFTSDRMEWGIRELGREIGVNPTTVFRVVNTLHNAGYLERNPSNQLYSLGPRVMKLASFYASKNPLPVVARKVFESYADRFEHNFYLGQLNHYEVIYLTVLDGRGPIKIVTEPGGTTNLHSTGLGKVMLAYQSQQFLQDYLNQVHLDHFTEHTIVNKEELLGQLEQVREKGYALNDGEQVEDIGAIGVPLHPKNGVATLAVSLAYPQHMILEGRLDLNYLISLTKEIATEINNQFDPSLWPEHRNFHR